MSERIRSRDPLRSPTSSCYSPLPKQPREASPTVNRDEENSLIWANCSTSAVDPKVVGETGAGGESLSFDCLQGYIPSPITEADSGVGEECVAKAVEGVEVSRGSLDSGAEAEMVAAADESSVREEGDGESEMDSDEDSQQDDRSEEEQSDVEDKEEHDCDEEGGSRAEEQQVEGEDADTLEGLEESWAEDEEEIEDDSERAEDDDDDGEWVEEDVVGRAEGDEEEAEDGIEEGRAEGEVGVVFGGEHDEEGEDLNTVVLPEGHQAGGRQDTDALHVTDVDGMAPEDSTQGGRERNWSGRKPPSLRNAAEARLLLEKLTEEGSGLSVSTPFLHSFIDHFITALPEDICSSITEVKTYSNLQEMAMVIRHTLRQLWRRREAIPATFDILKAEVELSDELRRMCTFIQTDDGSEEQQLTLEHWGKFRRLSTSLGLPESG
ncbi:hypothetical protein FOZ60_013077 [Perkinsus olseni]|uniref:Uncharacterized protein n=1 Tax=Perkinsus olseni TaxID=32597 RepID=A0A7J6P908_PEROL|nr:hypothetical protein FOZ60_013077 [Perkinsus olseni]